ncbi:hypothetical protein LCGC14_2174810, partial [marine sediment metagenome]
NEIWTPTSDMESLAEDFRKETEAMLKKVALENGCDVDELKFSVNGLGVVNIQRMTPFEMVEREEDRRKQKLRAAILERKKRG